MIDFGNGGKGRFFNGAKPGMGPLASGGREVLDWWQIQVLGVGAARIPEMEFNESMMNQSQITNEAGIAGIAFYDHSMM